MKPLSGIIEDPLDEAEYGPFWRLSEKTPDADDPFVFEGADRYSETVRKFVSSVHALSPYLGGLMERDTDRLRRMLDADPSYLIAEICEGLSDFEAEDEKDLRRELRLKKQEAALVIALADLAGAWDVLEVTSALTQFADASLQAAVRFLLKDALLSGKITGPSEADPARNSGLIILAMGKHGAGELNYSSDIDIIVFFDPDAADVTIDKGAQVFWVRLTKALVSIMQDRDENGYVFRTDLRLRPDPGATAAAISLPAALHYYESLGQNWERAAMIKARPCAGDIEAGKRFLAEIQPFIWRKYLDFAAIADVHSMKRQIHAHKGHGTIAVAGHNIKLGRGGIREIEFFVQTQQLIAGGRNAALRVPRTVKALRILTKDRWIGGTTAARLKSAYLFLRTLEHRIQMVRDEQTHTLPQRDDELHNIALLMGFDDVKTLTDALVPHMLSVEDAYAELFENQPSLSSETGSLVFTGESDHPETIETLSRMGYKRPADVSKVVRAWHFGRYPATRTSVARERLTEIQPKILEFLAGTADPDAAFVAFDAFLARLPVGVQIFSLIRSNPSILGLLALLLGAAPQLVETITRRPQIFDALIDPGCVGAVPDSAEMRERVDGMLSEAAYYEDLLDRARIVGKEQQFLIAVRYLTGAISAKAAGRAFSDLADLFLARLLDAAWKELARSHGNVPGARVAIIGMGRLGDRDMTLTSDLDLILVYDFDEEATASDGERPLAAKAYFIRLVQRFIAALSALTGAGNLYEVDFRLRPSGNSGPLATHIEALRIYQIENAWTWEHMALTRARVIGPDRAFNSRIERVIDDVLTMDRNPSEIFADALEMRTRVDREFSGDAADLKKIPGGLMDIEFIVQATKVAWAGRYPDILEASQSKSLEIMAAHGLLSEADREKLVEAAGFYRELLHLTRVGLSGAFDPKTAPDAFLKLVCNRVGLPDATLLEVHLNETQKSIRSVFKRIFDSEVPDPSETAGEGGLQTGIKPGAA